MGFVLFLVQPARLRGGSPSARFDSHFCVVHSGGGGGDYDADYEGGVSLGFCGQYYKVEY